MIKKIGPILICFLLLSVILIMVNNEVDVGATGGGGEGENESDWLDYKFMMEVTENYTSVIHNESIWKGKIPRGRTWGTDGDRWSANYTKKLMENRLGLTDVDRLLIGPINKYPYFNKTYSSKIEVKDFQITINNDNYPYDNPIPTSEIFPIPRGTPLRTCNYTYGNFAIAKLHDESENRIEPWPFAGTYNNYSLNLTQYDIEVDLVIGNVSYINLSNDETVPEDHECMVFLIDDVEDETQDRIDNMTNASGCIIIYDNADGPEYSDTSNCSFSVAKVHENDVNQDNLTQIKNLLESNETIIVDNYLKNGYLTFTYNLDDCPFLQGTNFTFLFHKIRPNNETGSYYDDFKKVTKASYYFYWLPRFKGFFIYDSFDTHFMTYAEKNYPGLPIFSINESVGEWLLENKSCTSISGYINQVYKREKQILNIPGVETYNVVGYRNITHSPGDKIVILSNRYDGGFWGEAAGDCALGGGVVLSIAKYFHDNNITPRYNLTFLMDTGEEYGRAGARHFRDSHPKYNNKTGNCKVIRWIGADQLGFNQAGTKLGVVWFSKSTRDIVWAIANTSKYYDKSGYNFEPYEEKGNTGQSVGGYSTDTGVWNDSGVDVDAFCICKDTDFVWNMYQRSGDDYTKGDVFDNIDPEDAKAVLDLFWNVTKYFCVNPDCWIPSNICLIKSDSDDIDDLDDTLLVGFDVESVLPYDQVWINSTLVSVDSGEAVMYDNQSFIANRTAISKNVSYTLPESESPGYYYVKTEIYNSTGIIDEIINPENDNVNVTLTTNHFFLYPYNYSLDPPVITNISAVPDPVGYGGNVTISADVTSNKSTIDKVMVNIVKPEDDPSGTPSSYDMNNTEGDTYEYVFNDTWWHGQYNYTIWAEDANGNETGSSQHSFNVSAQATVSVCTVQDEYDNNTWLNITDPPSNPSEVGYELLDDGDVLRIWNKYDSYYFDTNSGIQLTNHYDEYWSHNVLMLGYYNNDEWNLIYRTDELSGFNKNITSGETYVNATLWKDLNYAGYDFRLAISYHLGVDDNELTVIPYIKNLGQEIPYILGFGWEMKDIQIGMTSGGDYIEIDGTTKLLNQSLDETYTNLDDPCFYIREDHVGDSSESLYLRWDEDLSYKVQVKSREGQYNAPVTLGIKIGTLNVGQEKYTSLFWYDASEITYYFNNYSTGEAWASNPGYMVDGSTSNYASTTSDFDIELCDGNNCSGSDIGTISKVELRVCAYYSGDYRETILRPVFNGTSDGDNHPYQTPPGTGGVWSPWFEITNDQNAPQTWSWTDVDNLDCDVEAGFGIMPFTLYCSQVEIRVTYTSNNPPGISNPYPTDGSTGITIAPVLNITVSDPNGDNMNITWYSNSSGSSWVAFGTNNSVGNGTYHQTMSNASVNGQWWYWKVNVSDGTTIIQSSVYKFYTGYESKIENTGSTNFSGYLLMQIQFYDTVLEDWFLVIEPVNESSPRAISVGGELGLDTIFNGRVETQVLLAEHGNGTYRVYACFRDPDGDVLVCDDETLMSDSYEFTVTDT